jgi:tetratricopeptide (TPR) repeat protein/DNA-binding winged helix-turn-helix (wHTH) protein
LESKLLQGFRLGGRLVDPLRGQVTGTDGATHLPPKAVEVLLRLAKTPTQLVTREELLEQVWGKGKGSYEALGHAVSEIRRAFDDHHDAPRVVQTLPRRGYRLLLQPAFDDAPATPDAPGTPQAGPRWWQSLLRHGVIQAAAAYLVVGWLLIQVADTTFEKIGLPAWAEQFITFAVIGGFPVLLLLAWSLEFVNGRMRKDRGTQAGGILEGLERNYLAIVLAYGVAALGASIYQATVGFDAERTTVAGAAESELIPIATNSLAVLRLATFVDDPATRAFSDGLSEDILDGLARLPGLLVSARGDAWSLPANPPTETVRRRLRVANYIEGSVRLNDNRLKVTVQLIDSGTGYHRFSRNFETGFDDVNTMQREIATLVVANLKLAIDEEVVQSEPLFPEAASGDAWMLYQLGREADNRPQSVDSLNEAIGYFRQSLDVDPGYPAAHAGLCDAYTSLYDVLEDAQNIEDARQACSRALSVAPRLPVVIHAVARLELHTGNQARAERLYGDALTIDPQDTVAMRGIAQIRRLEQRFDEAEGLMRKAINLQPGNWRAINNLGNMYFGMGRYADAASEYRKVVFLDPDNFVTLGNLASTSLMSGDYAGARDAYAKALAIEEDATLLSNLGITYYYLGDFSAAIATLEKAVDKAPQSAANWLALGDALHAAGRGDAANSAYEHAKSSARDQLHVNDKDVDALTFLAWSTAMTGDTNGALELVAKATAIDPAYPYTYYYAALIENEAGRTDAAIDAAEKALANGYPVAMLAAEPILKPLTKSPRFRELLTTHHQGAKE